MSAMRNAKMLIPCDICGKPVLKKGLKKHKDMAHGEGIKYSFVGSSKSGIFRAENAQVASMADFSAELTLETWLNIGLEKGFLSPCTKCEEQELKKPDRIFLPVRKPKSDQVLILSIKLPMTIVKSG